MPITIEDMRNHIDKLIAELRATQFPEEDDFHVIWIEDPDPDEAYAITDPSCSPVEIHIPKVRWVDAYVNLHEIGHVYGRDQYTDDGKTRELRAWQWAREQALIWTAEMESIAQASLRPPSSPLLWGGCRLKRRHRLLALAFCEVRRFAATAAMRAAQTEHSWKRTDRGNSTVASAAPSFRPLSEAETSAFLGAELQAALSGARRHA